MRTRKRLRQRKQRRQRYRLTLTVIALAVLSVAVGATTAAFTATNTVASSRIANVTHTISVPELTPANCNATFYRISGPGISRSEAGHGGDANQIWLGTSAMDNINGGPGVDCMLPGGVPSGSTDATTGGGGTNYCYSGPGPGSYTFKQCDNNTTYPTGPYTTVESGPFS